MPTVSQTAIALLIFTRTPVPGEVKTRLIPALGAQGACDLYIRLVARTLSLCSATGFASTQLWLSESAAIDNVPRQRWQAYCPHTVHTQRGQDLGERMRHAFDNALQDHTAAVLIGCDCLGLLQQDLLEARRTLEGSCDAVLGACEDGGYYLLGLRRSCPALFSDMQWGATDVASRTRARLRSAGMAWHELATRWDLDQPDDLRRLKGTEWEWMLHGDEAL